MAKAAAVELHPQLPFGEAAARTVAVRADELWQHSANVLDTSDIERVHAMRVATRRLRAAMEVFAECFPRKQHRSALREVKALADALGERRDPDVAIAELGRVAETMSPADGPGLNSLMAEFRGEQELGNETLAGALESVRESGLEERLAQLALAARREAPEEESA